MAAKSARFVFALDAHCAARAVYVVELKKSSSADITQLDVADTRRLGDGDSRLVGLVLPLARLASEQAAMRDSSHSSGAKYQAIR